jgi:hypothetical protein
MIDTTEQHAGVLAELNRFRLDRDLTYQALAADIEEKLGAKLSWRTLHALLNTPPDRPRDRTIHKIRRYLDVVRTPRRKATTR